MNQMRWVSSVVSCGVARLFVMTLLVGESGLKKREPVRGHGYHGVTQLELCPFVGGRVSLGQLFEISTPLLHRL